MGAPELETAMFVVKWKHMERAKAFPILWGRNRCFAADGREGGMNRVAMNEVRKKERNRVRSGIGIVVHRAVAETQALSEACVLLTAGCGAHLGCFAA